ncbi:MAG: UbiA prenyltransferase family protein [Candidatus Thermoplasmatota archaeon]
MSGLPPLLSLMRPRQWYKNLVVFIPLLFSGNASSTALWAPILVCFAAFCALSSSVYAANDVVDADRDRLHPRKKERPIASGKVSPATGGALSLLLALAALAALWWLGPLALVLGTAYLLLQVLYNGLLKRLVLWDALAIAVGFVVRALAGSAAIDVPSTEWLIVCTFLFALYLAFAKRRHELLLAQDDPRALESRPILGAYTVPFIEQSMQTSATLLLMAYSLYTFFGTDSWMMFTIPFAIYGVFRFSWLVHRRDLGDEAEMVFRDRATLANAILWLATIVAVKAGWPQAAYEWLHALG